MIITNSDYEVIKRQMIRTRRNMFHDFGKFRTYYFKHYHKTDDALFHLDLVGLLNRISITRNIKLALAAPRGSAKSTIVTLEFVIYLICQHLEEFIIIISSNAEQAAEYLTNIKHELETNDRLKIDFPEVCELGKKPEPLRWSQREIITKNNIKVTALSVGQKIRGKRHNEHRPGLVILDDIEGNEMAQNEDNRYKLKDWFEKSVLKVGDKRTNFIFAGTIHHYGSLLAQYTNPQQSPGWESRIYRSIIKWPDATNEWQMWINIYRSNEEYNGRSGADAAMDYFNENREKMLEGTEVLWPQSKSYYDLMVMREQEGTLSFDSEMQNEPVNPRDCFFNVEEFHFWDKKYPDEQALITSMKSPRFFMACDPSLGKDKTHGDYSAILIGVKDGAEKVLYVVDVDMERRQPANLIETILGYCKAKNIRQLAFESNNFQQLLVDEIKKGAGERGLFLQIKPIENRKDKIARIQALEPFLKIGQIQFSRKHRALSDQLKYFPKGQHDDGPDALEMLYQSSLSCFSAMSYAD